MAANIQGSEPADPAILGVLDSPGSVLSADSAFAISGWLLARAIKIQSIELAIDGAVADRVSYGLPRPDLVRAQAGVPADLRCGFYGQMTLDRRYWGHEVDLEVIAVLADGRRVVGLTRRVRVVKPVATPWTRYPAVIREAIRKAVIAFRENRLPFSPWWWVKAFALHWQETTSGRLVSLGPEATDRASLEASYAEFLHRHKPRAASATNAEPMSIVAFASEVSHVEAIVRSAREQAISSWELWLVWRGDGTIPMEAYAGDLRIRPFDSGAARDAAAEWLPPGQSRWLIFLPAGVRLAPYALSAISDFVVTTPAEWVYTDDDCIDEEGRRSDPYLKGAFNPELALVDDYATRLAIVRRSAVEKQGGLRWDFEDAQVYDLFLRAVENGVEVAHLPEVCAHRPTATAPMLTVQQCRATERALARRRRPATVESDTQANIGSGVTRIRWGADVTVGAMVTIVIPTRDRVDLLRPCIASLRETVACSRTKLLIIDDQSQEPQTAVLFDELARDSLLSVRILRDPVGQPFNYSKLINDAARVVDTPLMLHLNNDVIATSPGWLDQMVGWMADPQIGAVGAKLLYPDGSIQHAGVLVGTPRVAPEHLFSRLRNDDAGYQWLPHRPRTVSAVTGACLLTRTELFWAVGGFDDEHLRVQFNDVDYCLKVIAAGLRVVYEPSAVLYHLTSASRGRRIDLRENDFFLEKHRDYRDTFFSPLLVPESLLGPTPLVR